MKGGIAWHFLETKWWDVILESNWSFLLFLYTAHVLLLVVSYGR